MPRTRAATSIWTAVREDLRFRASVRAAGRMTRAGPAQLAIVSLTSPGCWQLMMHRVAHASDRRRQAGGSPTAHRLLTAAMWPIAMALKFLTKNEIFEFTVFEPGVFLSDRGGIVLGARRIGAGTLVHRDVTIGMNLTSGGVPDVGRNVWVGHDCVVHGEISIGDGVTILPGSVLTKSVPPGVLVAGNPARVVIREFDNAGLRSSDEEEADVLPGRANAVETPALEAAHAL